MLPITMDVLLRVLGQAVVLVVAPPLGLLSALIKWFLDVLSSSIVMRNVNKTANANKRQHLQIFLDEDSKEFQDRMNAVQGTFMRIFGGNLISPIHFAASSRVTKDLQRKVYALNRIIMSTAIFIELSLCLVIFPAIESNTVCTNICEERSSVDPACHESVATKPLVFYPLTLALMLFALLSTVESVLMMCGFKNTPSDTLLFEQGDLPEKVS